MRVFRYQKNTGRRACIFLLLLIIFGLILVLIFKPRRHSTPIGAAPPSAASSVSAVDAVEDGADEMLPPLPMVSIDLSGLGLGNGAGGGLRMRMRTDTG